MPYSKKQVYQKQNLRFATKDPERSLPTLYFRTPHGSGRLRQEHPSGPKVQEIRKHTSHAFFPDRESLDRFAESFDKGMTRSEFRDLRKTHGGRHTPTEGFHHFEATFDRHSRAGKATTTHKSGGTVIALPEMSEAEVKRAHHTTEMGQQQHQITQAFAKRVRRAERAGGYDADDEAD